ncbi:MAG: C40 family peptidase [Oscillospiraceae bacterium]|nr:C40 family peptidase [Oscillospiraceae bacterium]
MKYFWKNAGRALFLSLLLTMLCSVSAFAGTQGIGVGTVTASSLRMRNGASTSNSVVMNLARNTVVSVLGESNGWYQVAYGGKSGYVSGDYLTVANTAEGISTYGKVTGSSVNVRSDAGTDFAKVTAVKKGASVTVTGFKSGWYQISVSGKTGWIRSDYVDLYASRPSGTSSSAGGSSNSAASSIPAASAVSNGQTYTISSTVSDLIAYAKSYLGVPYVYGGASARGFDCSGYTMYIFKHFGINLPHSATSQLGYGIPVTREELQPGDLVFFRDTNYSTKAASHVGIYIGNSQFIHATSSRGGKYVDIDSLNEAYHSRVFTVGRRLIVQ